VQDIILTPAEFWGAKACNC